MSKNYTFCYRCNGKAVMTNTNGKDSIECSNKYCHEASSKNDIRRFFQLITDCDIHGQKHHIFCDRPYVKCDNIDIEKYKDERRHEVKILIKLINQGYGCYVCEDFNLDELEIKTPE